MEEGKERKFGTGRGGILLKLLQEKERAESKTVSPGASSSKGQSETSSNDPPMFKIPSSVGRGRASLLQSVEAKLIAETQSPKSVLEPVPIPIPIPVSGQGRGSLISRLKFPSSVQKVLEQPPSIIEKRPEPPPSVIEKRPEPPPSVIEKRPEQPPSVIEKRPEQPVHSNTEMVKKLSDLTIQESASTSGSSLSHLKPVCQKGTSGKPIQLSANYINIKLDPGKGLFNYEVKFNPDVDSRPLRRKLLNQHVEALGRTRVFDGAILFLPQKLEQDVTIFESTHPMDGSKVTLRLIYQRKQSISENVTFFNVLLGRVMRALSLIRIGQHSFNPKGVHAVPQHKLEVWPGYVTAINEFDGGLKLCIDARHRVVRTETVRELMITFKSKPNFQHTVIRELVGLSVFTRYNNRTYRVDDIAWDKNPTCTFDKGTETISFIDYYKFHWNLEIKDKDQPLLVHCAKTKLPNGETQETMILLVPELCYIASLSESIRSDFRIMKDLDALTKMAPNARRDVFKHFIEEVNKNDVPREILAEWGLTLESDITEFTGRVLEPETIFFANNVKFVPPADKPAEWSSVVCRNALLRTPSLNNWYVIHCQRDSRCANEFVLMLKNVTKVMGITVRDPQTVCLKDDRIESFVRALRDNIQHNVNLMVIIFPTNRSDRYSAVKRVCCVEMPVPSQVVMSRTISRGDKLKSITQKIALQINCKLGGTLWALSIPVDKCMICGIDVYHSGVGQSMKGSVAGFVASLDKLLTVWHSKICLQGKHQELIDMLQTCLLSALKAYYKHNKCYPDRIIVYRDGVGDGQLDTVARYEVKQLLATLKNIEPNYQPTLTMIIVQKRITTRLFERCRMGLNNPPPGTIVDSVITKPGLYDFYLVSQNIRQGTVSPTHYIVIYDNKNMKAEHIQRLTYKLCHLYYNWPGTIKVPAPCQYAHKLVSLVGQNIQLEPHHSLTNTLYYL